MVRKSLLLFGMLIAGCVTTDVGNPVEIEVGFAAYEEQPVNALSLDSGITITRALISVEGLRFADAERCSGDPTVDAPGRFTVDLLEGVATPAVPRITRAENEFCALTMRLSPLPSANDTQDDMVSEVDTEMAGFSVLVDGLRADGTPFEIRAAMTDLLALDAVGRAFTLEGREHVVVGFAMNEWLPTFLNTQDAGSGVVRVSDLQHPVIQSLRNGVTGSSRLFRDLDRDGGLSAVEVSEPLAVGISVDVDVTLDPDELPFNADVNSDPDDPDVPVDELCAVMDDGPGYSVSAVESVSDDPAAADYEESRIDVQLVDQGDGDFFGVVLIPRDDDNDWVVGFEVDVPLVVLDEDGEEVPPAETNVLICDEVAASYGFDTEPGDYFLLIGPTTLETIRFIYDD